MEKSSTNVLHPLSSKIQNTKPGPKPKPIQQRKLTTKDLKTIVRPERSWSQKQKIRVLVFLSHHRIPLSNGEYRRPTQQEASDVYGVPQTTISEWVRKQGGIEKLGGTSIIRSARTLEGVICRWPELESRLYNLFLEKRAVGQPIRRGWFRLHANVLFREIYPNASTSIFRFSNGWFEAFLGRYRISLRCITKKAQKVPEDYRRLIVSWLQFNRRNSQLLGGSWMETVLNRELGRFQLSNICNLDETPLPFEYLSGKTYNPVGDRTVWVKETRNGWDKRQASLVLCIFADGVNRIPPMIIFHGKGISQRLINESKEYHPGVIVEFNQEAYITDTLFLKYIDTYLLPALEGRPSLFALDMCKSHKTTAVLDKLHQNNIVPSIIPAGCTSLVQPLDVSINKPLKDKIRDLTDEAIIEHSSTFEKWTTAQRRVLTTWCVGDAWYGFCIEKQQLVKKVFRKVGLSLPVDGSADHELDIKGFAGLEIGDCRRSYTNTVKECTYAEVSRQYDDSEAIEFIADGE